MNQKVTHRDGKRRGLLAENAVGKYFKSYDYTVKSENGKELDHSKIDLIAENKKEIIYIQTKAGEISNREIKKIVNNVKAIIELPCNKNFKKIRVCIVADKFHKNAELERIRLEEESGLGIMFINMYQILDFKNEYKEALKRE